MICIFFDGRKAVQKKYQTKTNQKIIEYIKTNAEHSFSASDVYSYVLDNGVKANLATIYRNLDKLTEDKTLLKTKSQSSDSFLYQYAGEHGECQSHLHMQCSKCGKIFHLQSDFMGTISEYLSNTYGFKLDCKGSSLSGLCMECRAH